MARGRTFDQGPRARDLFDSGLSCNAIARELGVSPSTISGWAKREGISFDRKKTAKAVAAQRIDRAAVRADIIDRLYQRTQRVMTRLEADQYLHRMATADGVKTFRDEFPPALDEKNLAGSIGIYLDKATRLELIDGDQGESSVKSMLAELGEYLGHGS